MTQCCAADKETKEQCKSQATYMIVGFDHDLTKVSDNKYVHKGYVVGGEYPVCEPCIDKLRGWVMMRHFKMEVWAIDTYTPILEMV